MLEAFVPVVFRKGAAKNSGGFFQATGEVEVVKRAGKWCRAAVQRYLRDDGGNLKILSGQMASKGATEGALPDPAKSHFQPPNQSA